MIEGKSITEQIEEKARARRSLRIICALLPLLLMSCFCLYFFYSSNTLLEISALAISLLSFYLTIIRPLCRKPKLCMIPEYKIRCSKSPNASVPDSWFVRFAITNTGAKPAHNCVVKLLQVRDDQMKHINKFDPLYLCWARQDKIDPITIQSNGDFNFADLAQIRKKENETKNIISLRVSLHDALEQGQPINSPGSDPILLPGTYYLLIAAYSDESFVKPTWYKLKVCPDFRDCSQDTPIELFEATDIDLSQSIIN